jgi:hypothetical protein
MPTPKNQWDSTGESQDDKLIDRGGFRDLGHFARTIALAGARPEQVVDGSILGKYNGAVTRAMSVTRAVVTPDGMAENTAPDGGVLVPPHFSRRVWDKARFRDTPMSRAETIFVDSNQGEMPAIAETSRVSGSGSASRWGGLQALWEVESQQA